MARLGAEVEGRREGAMSFTNMVDDEEGMFKPLVLRLVRVLGVVEEVGKGKPRGVVSIRGREESDEVEIEA